MSSYKTYSSHHSNSNHNNSSQHPYSSRSTSPSTTLSPPSPTNGSRGTGATAASAANHIDSQTPIYTIDYSHSAHSSTSGPIGAQRSASPSSPIGSPTSTLHSSNSNSRSNTFNSQKRTASPTMAFSNTPLPEPTRWKRVRLTVMRLATVERLQLLWGLLALLGTVSWISLLPAYSFRNGLGRGTFKDPSYTLFLVATVGTSFSAIWQSLCPFLIRQSQRALLPRIINHPSTQTATIVVSIVLTVLNFFSWIILASGGDTGAHTNCQIGPLADRPGYISQCQAVNVAIAVDAVVFLLWIPISVVIVCGTVERGLWWWGEDDGWAQGEAGVGGSNMMSEEEFDMKIGGGGSKRIKRRQTVFPTEEDQAEHPRMVMIQQPKPAFVTPIASQFRSTGGEFGDDLENGDDEELGNFTPSSYRRHHQQRQQQQRQRLQRKASTNSLSSRLSTFFGAGWGTDAMPPPSSSSSPTEPVPALPPMPAMPSQYAQENARNAAAAAAGNTGGNTVTASTRKKKDEEKKKEEEDEKAEEDVQLHGGSYESQWHSRWS
ncbi:hypothetical protein BGZ96_009092 [Linnemannia gamsii]|uniref:MARVEL domain-containing protein n=1 Tax=Linnemannia gamsii TaxID=64522 RepID=A0ABQ7JXU1_9FUNG|nr:hypothetical protein BGZ96_009092 [Linnemannia gamsii]